MKPLDPAFKAIKDMFFNQVKAKNYRNIKKMSDTYSYLMNAKVQTKR